MNIKVFQKSPDGIWPAAIELFEFQFTYPLGSKLRFRISHGQDSWRFFQAMGDAVYIIAERDGQVIGALGAALRSITQVDGSKTPTIYIGDLKISPADRGGLIFIRLIRALREWIHGRATHVCAVVMNGTSPTPTDFSGRMGLPNFTPMHNLGLLWVHTDGKLSSSELFSFQAVSEDDGLSAYTNLSSEKQHFSDSDTTRRSRFPAQWLVSADRRACGRLEDTLGAKRLYTTDGEEMRSMHLSCFVYKDFNVGMALCASAMVRAHNAGYPMLFVAIPAAEAEMWRTFLGKQLQVVAPATFFVAGFEVDSVKNNAKNDGSSPAWIINSADI